MTKPLNITESRAVELIIIFVAIFFFLLNFPLRASASATDGTIDSVYKYAWSANAGWINFGASEGNVHITDSVLTGYAWSANYGWINLAPTKSGVTNNNQGTLSGYAWGEKLGWINFSGVVINSSGEFTGSAFNNISGTINFDCAKCKVKTDWRPRSVRPQCNNSIDDDNDSRIDYPADPGCSSLDDADETDPVSSGGGMPAQWNDPPVIPVGGFRILINNGAEYTNSPIAILNLFGGSDTERMAISNFSDFKDADQEKYQTSKTWDLCKGKYNCPEGKHIVYVKFYAPWGRPSEVISDSIIYKKEAAAPEKPTAEIPTNYRFTANLKYNRRGDDVRYLQMFLKSQGSDIYPEGIVSGWFGPLTKDAVIRFQEKYASDILAPWRLINGTGFVGKTTRDKINKILGR